jgi:predicted amidohydrolase
MAMTNYPTPVNNGNSVAFGAEGAMVAQSGETETITIARFDLAALREYRQKTVWGNAFRRPHRYGALSEHRDIPVFRRTNGHGENFDAGCR